jgi:hypothetical protein
MLIVRRGARTVEVELRRQRRRGARRGRRRRGGDRDGGRPVVVERSVVVVVDWPSGVVVLVVDVPDAGRAGRVGSPSVVVVPSSVVVVDVVNPDRAWWRSWM